MGLKYLSIDLETGGIDSTGQDVLEFAAVYDDLSNPSPDITALPQFHAYIVQDTYRTQPYAAAMHERIWKVLRDKKDPDNPNAQFIKADKLAFEFQWWLYDIGVAKYKGESEFNERSKTMYRDRVPARITVLGKNFGAFDMRFLEELPDFKKRIEIRHRIADPAVLFLRPDDDTLPDLKTCKERAKMFGDVSHTAVDDALDTIKVFRYGLNVRNAQT